MGKQINYYIEYDNFILLAQKALDIGCKILKEDLQTNVVIESDSTDIISRDCSYYYFYIPEAGNYKIKKIAPYTEVEHYVLNPMYIGEKFITKEYITTESLAYVEKSNFKI